MRKGGFPKVLKSLADKGYGKKVVSLMIDKATKEVNDPQGTGEALGLFYDNFWKDRIDEETDDKIKELFPSCPNCEEPIFVEHEGYNGAYCSDRCRDNAEEYLYECDQCGGTFDTEYYGGWIDDQGFCSDRCVWRYLEEEIENAARSHGYHPERSFIQIRDNSEDAPWYDNGYSRRGIERDLERYGVPLETEESDESR